MQELALMPERAEIMRPRTAERPILPLRAATARAAEAIRGKAAVQTPAEANKSYGKNRDKPVVRSYIIGSIVLGDGV
ncbi:hypothetical protein D3C75_1245300 [compost metagenome]